MNTKRRAGWRVPITAICVAAGVQAALGQGAGDTASGTNARDVMAARIQAFGEAMKWNTWPKPAELRVAPAVSKELLTKPDLATKESVTYGFADFGKEPWGKATWIWQNLARKQTADSTLSEEEKQLLLRRLSAEQARDPEFVKMYLERKRRAQHESRRQKLDGQIEIEVALTPDAPTAQRLLLSLLSVNMLPDDALLRICANARDPELGDIGFVTRSRQGDDARIRFVRNNVCVQVWATGTLVQEAAELARKLDAAIVGQPPLSSSRLMERRPSVKLDEEPCAGGLGFTTVIPDNQEMGVVLGQVNGHTAGVIKETVPLVGRKGSVHVRVVVVTKELLAGESQCSVDIE